MAAGRVVPVYLSLSYSGEVTSPFLFTMTLFCEAEAVSFIFLNISLILLPAGALIHHSQAVLAQALLAFLGGLITPLLLGPFAVMSLWQLDFSLEIVMLNPLWTTDMSLSKVALKLKEGRLTSPD